MTVDEKIGLKLIGKNKEDLQVISAYIQDSVTTVKDIVYLKKNRSFVMIVSRFMWEDIERGVFRENKRIRCAIKFEDVLKVKSKSINQKNKNKILECLAIKCSSSFDGIYNIKIYFSGGGTITMISDVIDIVLDDLGKPWNVKHVPIHKI